MPPGRGPGGMGFGGGRGREDRGRGRGGGSRPRGRGRGGRSSGRGTALPSSLTGRGGGRGGGAKGNDRSRRRAGGQNDNGYEFDDGGAGVSDRHKYDDEAGDSDDGPGPEDSDFEDEEVDEDAAFDSADEARYGEIMDTILERRSGKQGGGGGEDEDESNGESSDGGEEGGGMSVMDMLAANEAAGEAAKNGPAARTGKDKSRGKGKGKGRARASVGAEEESSRTAPASEASSASASGDDGSGFQEGDAMDEDEDEGGDASDEEGYSDEDGEGEGNEEERHARLMGFVGALGDQAAAAHRAADDRRSSQLLKEGEFNATAVTASGGGVAADAGQGAVTMETLMGSLQNSKGFAAVKKQVAAFSGKSGTPSAPVSKAAELRAERETAYDSRKSDMGKWVAPVQANRKAETLDFTPATKTNLSNAALASKMDPTTDMEKEVEMLLTAGGASETGLAEKEMEELKSKAYTMEEVQERQAELSKMRALMFYQERKQHHINKIKSKVYRKIKKRQRERAGDGQPEDDGDRGEAAARKRAEERMSLRHKNTTKWVKNVLRAKGGAGKDDRKAIAEQLKIGQELRAKMDGVDNDSSADDSSPEEEEEEANAGKNKKRKSALRDSDRQELEDIGGADGNEEGIVAGGKGAALLKMAFMQKAMDKQRLRAREEASVVLRELEEASVAAAADEDGSFGDEKRVSGSKGNNGKGRAGGASWREDVTSDGTGGGGVNTRASKETRDKAAAAEVAMVLPAGALQSTAVSMDARVRSAVASAITIDLQGRGGGAGGGGGGGNSVSSVGVSVGAEGGKTKSLNRPGHGAEAENMAADSRTSEKGRHAGTCDASGSVKRTDTVSVGREDEVEEEVEGGDESNPWLVPTPRRSKERKRAPNGEVMLDVRKAAVTALSAFGGASDNDEDSNANGSGAGVARAVDAADGAPGSEAGGVGKDRKPRAGQSKRGGRNRRRKKQRGGSGREDASDSVIDEGTEKVAGTKRKARGSKEKAKTAKEGQKKSDGPEDVSGGNNSKKRAKKTAKGGPEGVDANGKEKGGGAPASTAKLAGLSNDELVRRAFAAPDFDSEFKETKDAEVEEVLAKGREKLPGSVAGWGSWAGNGAPVQRSATRREVLAKEAQAKREEGLKKARKDDRLPKVVLNEKRQKRSAKYMVSEVPYPFTSREQYERSLRQPIGGEWNTSQSVRAMTRPAVVVRAGVAVAPMKLGKLHRDNAKAENPANPAKGAKDGEGKTRGGARRRRGSKGGR